jgi:hypothetical protein
MESKDSLLCLGYNSLPLLDILGYLNPGILENSTTRNIHLFALNLSTNTSLYWE